MFGLLITGVAGAGRSGKSGAHARPKLHVVK